ncbi:MAG: family 16 glycoside hydrolase [Gemmataceae bacterium]
MPLDSKAVKDVFLAAIDKPTRAERDAFLEGACAADDALRRRVEALLKEHEQSGSFPDFLGVVNGTQDHLPAPDAITATCGDPVLPGRDRPLDFLAPPRQPGHLGRLEHYEIHSVVGQGGMGVVLKAVDERLNRVVAVKVLAPQFAANAAARRRFIREAKAIAAVTHEHVVTVHAVSDDDDPHPYIVMQLIQGVSLQDRLDKTGPLELKEILRIGLQAARGLAAAHAQGLVHRDIKPANILLENGVERVKITDFGLARAVDDASVTQSGTIAGTPLFMSPEQAAGDAVDPRSDLFSLGSVLYVLCTGRPPFRATGTMAVMKRVIEDEPRPIRDINPDIPDWLEAIIARLHAKNPADRFQSAKEVADLLEQHLAHLQQPNLVPNPATAPHPRTSTEAKLRHWRLWLAVFLAPQLLLPVFYALYVLFGGMRDLTFGLIVVAAGGVILTGLSIFILIVRRMVAKPGAGSSSVVPKPPRVERPARTKPPSLALPRALIIAPVVAVVLVVVGLWLGVISSGGTRILLVLLALPAIGSLVAGIILLELFDARRASRTDGEGGAPMESVAQPVKSRWRWGLRAWLLVSLFPVVALFEMLLLKALPKEMGNGFVEFKVFSPINVVLAGLIAFWLVFRYRRNAAARRSAELPKPKSARQKHSRSTVWPVASLVIGAGLIVLIAPTIIRYLSNRGELLLEPQRGLVGINVLQDNVVVHDWMDMQMRQSLRLSPGKYRLNASGGPGYQISGWEVTTDGLFSGHASHQGGESCELNLERGERVTVRALMRPVPSVPSIPVPLAATDKDRLQGDWVAVSGKSQGQPFSANALKSTRVKFTGGSARITMPGNENGEATFKFDSTSNFKEIDVIRAGDTLAMLGIYRLVGDRLTICLGDPGQPRPRSFPTEHDARSGCMVVEFRPSTEGWVQLFNGKDLTGWKYHPTQPGNWKVENGHLVGRLNYGRPNHLFSERGDFQDFHLRAEVMIDPTGNSGIYFRSPFELRFLGGVYPPAHEAQIYNDDSPTNNDAYKTGSLHGVVMYDKVLVRGEQWLTLEIIARGQHVTVRVNGQTTVDETLPYDPNRKEPRGHIALQAEKGTVRFRKIEIKELPIAARHDVERLRGAWRAVSVERTGKALTPEEVRSLRFDFAGNTLTSNHMEKGPAQRMVFTLDPTKSPKQITLKPAADSTFVIEGIYRFDGDRLVVCMAMFDIPKSRPPTFALDPADPARALMTFERVPPPGPAGGWVSLFNGKDLTGWQTHPDQPGDWKVENGVLIGRGPRSHLFSERGDYQDFHFRVEAAIGKGGNSGVFFRAGKELISVVQRGKQPAGYEAQIVDSDEPNTYRTASIIPIGAAPTNLIKPDEWFTLEVVATGNHLVTKLNGAPIVSKDDASNMYRKGHFALQVWSPGTVVKFRKIEIKELPATPKDGGFVPLFNGRDLKGWKTHSDQPGQWQVKNGVLTGRGERSHLYSERGDYQDFHLRAEVRINDGGNSGLFFRSGFGPDFDVLRLLSSRPPNSETDRKIGLPLGYEADIKLDNEFSRTGSVWSLPPLPIEPVHKAVKESLVTPGTWFTFEVIAQGNHIVTKVNGKTALDWVDEQNSHTKGHFALQVSHPKTIVEFRKIEVRELPD